MGRSINKSHTSSINIKLSQEATADHIRIPLKHMMREKGESGQLGKVNQPMSQHKKYSVKLQSNEKENHARRRDQQPYDVTIFRPFQDTNRYLETERLPKDYKPQQERTPTKQPLRLRTDHQDQKHIRTDYTDTTPDKYRKEVSTKHTTESSSKLIRVPAEDVRRLIGELLREQKEVAELKR